MSKNKKHIIWGILSIFLVISSIIGAYYVKKHNANTKISANLTKEASFLGDSITKGIGTNKPYLNLIGKQTGWKINNYGIPGSTICNIRPETSFANRVSTISDTSNFIVIFGGTNDYGLNAPIGTIESTDNSNFYGALNNIITWFLTNRPSAKLVLVTPLKRYYVDSPDKVNVDGDLPNKSGCTLKDYVDAIVKIGEKYSVPVVDLYRNAGIDPKIEIQRTTWMPDGIHPNDKGHEERLYPLILRELI